MKEQSPAEFPILHPARVGSMFISQPTFESRRIVVDMSGDIFILDVPPESRPVSGEKSMAIRRSHTPPSGNDANAKRPNLRRSRKRSSGGGRRGAIWGSAEGMYNFFILMKECKMYSVVFRGLCVGGREDGNSVSGEITPLPHAWVHFPIRTSISGRARWALEG